MSDEAETGNGRGFRPPGALFIVRGMAVAIPDGGLVLEIGPDGEPKMSSLTFHLLVDVCPHWLGIALDHLETAEIHHEEVMAALKTTDDNRLGAALETEFRCCMQSITASAIAVDAFYASVKQQIDLPEELTRTWREKRTARHKQIAEVLRRAFRLSREGGRALPKSLEQLFHYRDQAAHPSAKLQPTLLHPDLNLQTEWRFVYYRLHNAKTLAQLALAVVAQLVRKPRVKYTKLVEYCTGAVDRVEPLVVRWESLYGELYPGRAPG
jgi:hypothetical protein